MNRVGIHGMVWVGGTSPDDCERAISGSRAAGHDLIELPVFDPSVMPVDAIVRSLARHDLDVRCSLGLSRDADIRVNTINPGLILTPDWIRTAKELTESTGGDWEGHLAGVAREHAAIDRFGSPAELANFFVFLCSNRASYSVGSTYFVDGGMLKTV